MVPHWSAVSQFLRRRWRWLAPLSVLVIAALYPLPRTFLHPPPRSAVRIEDREGRLLYEVREEDHGAHRFLPLEKMPRAFRDAVIAIEDRGFYGHLGVSFRAVGRAVTQNLGAGRVVSGGSTITQQLVRNRLRPARRTFAYKIWEALLALKLDAALSKDEILESYLNTVFYGHQAYGIEAAARTYFGKSPQELSIGESSMLAGVLQSPAALDPFRNPQGALDRRKRVLDALVETGGIDDRQYADALEEPVTLGRDAVSIRAPHFVFWLMGERPELLEGGTHTVRTTLDLPLQQELERIVARRLVDLADKRVTSAAVVVLDARTGDVLAMIGSADYFDTAHDGAVNVAISPRQPGSALKPFTYALALERGDTPATTVADIEARFFTEDGTPYVPRNYDYGFHGLVRYREALANSYNVAAVKVLEKVGVPALMALLRDAGVETLTQTPEHYGLALTLGDAEVTLLELARAYAVFPRGGETLTLRATTDDPAHPGTRILDARTAWLITDILDDDAARLQEFGAQSPLAFPFPVAAKTGTTRNSRDNWTMGYTPDLVVGVWVGNADNTPMQGTSGVTGAGPIFHDAVLAAVRLHPPRAFPQPPGIVRAQICALSGKLPTPACPNTVGESFAEGTEPREPDDIFRPVRLDARNGLLATDACPPAFVTEKVFAVFPPDVRSWARENGWPDPPTQASPLCGGEAAPPPADVPHLRILRPGPGDAFALDPLIPDRDEQILLEAQADSGVRTVEWFVDGVKTADGRAPDFRAAWKPVPGRHVIQARSGDLRASVTIQVED